VEGWWGRSAMRAADVMPGAVIIIAIGTTALPIWLTCNLG
jgi:hypothetical protein